MITVKHLETQTYVLLYMLLFAEFAHLKSTTHHMEVLQCYQRRSWNRHLMCGNEIVIFVLYHGISSHNLPRLKSFM